MNNGQFKQKLDAFTKALVIEMPRINESVAMNAYALVKDRVINEGEIGTGKNLGGYSTNELPTFFFKGKSLNQGGEKAVEKAKKEHKGLSYKDWRSANNLETDHVSLSFTGQMWKDIGVTKQVVDGNKIITTVGAKNTKNRDGKTTDDILGFNADRYGDVLTVNKTEETLIARTYDVMLQQLIDKNFG
jgi:hypothetical protein